VIKSLIWAISLGSGTSGGVLAPLLMIGGAVGGIEAMFLPNEGVGFWPMISMGAILGGTMRAPFTGVIFAIELTHDMNVILPLLVANAIAYGFTVLCLKRSILTEKIARRGFHLSREYSIDPLEILFVREVMRTSLIAFPESQSLEHLSVSFRLDHPQHGQHLYPIVDQDRRVVGLLTRKDLKQLLSDDVRKSAPLGELARRQAIVAKPDEPLRVVVDRMAETGFTRLPVVDANHQLVGLISLEDLLHARTRNLTEERHRERVLKIRLPFRGRTQSVDGPR
jgi:CIC family chloride channel protein